MTACRPLYEAASYSILGRALFYVTWLSPVHPGRVWNTFFGLAFLVESISATGASFSSDPSAPQSTQDAGKALIEAALILQVVQRQPLSPPGGKIPSPLRQGWNAQQEYQGCIADFVTSAPG